MTYTPEEFAKFDRLTRNTSSQNGAIRVMSRIDLSGFIKEHGKEKCDEMWEVIKKRDKL
jgi:hypothetical protein